MGKYAQCFPLSCDRSSNNGGSKVARGGGGGDRGLLEITKKIIEHNIAHRHSPSKFEKTINPLYYIILNMILRRQRKAK